MELTLYCPDCQLPMIKEIDTGGRANFYCEDCDISVQVGIDYDKEVEE